MPSRCERIFPLDYKWWWSPITHKIIRWLDETQNTSVWYISPFLVPMCQAGDSQSISTSAQHPSPGRWMAREVLHASFAVPFVSLLSYSSEVDKHKPSRIFFGLSFPWISYTVNWQRVIFKDLPTIYFRSSIYLYKTQTGLYSSIYSFVNLH